MELYRSTAKTSHLLASLSCCPSADNLSTWTNALDNISGINWEYMLAAISEHISHLEDCVRLQVLQQQQQQQQHQQQQQTQSQQLQQLAQTAQPDVSAIVSAVFTAVMPVFASRTAPKAAPTPPTASRFPTHPQGKSVACIFPLFPAQIVHKILLLTFSLSNLHHLCTVVGEEHQPSGQKEYSSHKNWVANETGLHHFNVVGDTLRKLQAHLQS
ncbi:hypothetical protein HK100_001484 [Physocladia obscura]|uniref:Uncharacterized protein n=1 Tax=Physocladia obscura TaxID=109957 RepID=A0AAD5XHD1_9FUNG|nr:hypothetical protein HK100_001484 [Physocladia obscura]